MAAPTQAHGFLGSALNFKPLNFTLHYNLVYSVWKLIYKMDISIQFTAILNYVLFYNTFITQILRKMIKLQFRPPTVLLCNVHPTIRTELHIAHKRRLAPVRACTKLRRKLLPPVPNNAFPTSSSRMKSSNITRKYPTKKASSLLAMATHFFIQINGISLIHL